MRSLGLAIQVPFSYPVYFTRDVFEPANPLLTSVLAGSRDELPAEALFVVDDGVLRGGPDLLGRIVRYCASHRGELEPAGPPLVVPGGETAKTGRLHLDAIHAVIERAGLCRHSYLVAIGGGAVLDLAGYAAATAHRGIRLVRLPTTVLAQNDAGIGVKNGINGFGKKNWVGTFAPPHAVINDAAFLDTLSDRDWRAGIAEAVKVGLVKDPAFFESLEASVEALVERDLPAMERLIHRCAELHLEHIGTGGDPFELRSARPLDFGHWTAHKLEELTAHRLRHGEAVAIGIALDTTYSCLAGHLDAGPWGRTIGLLRAAGFELWVPELSRDLDRPESPACVLRGLDEFRQHLGGPLTITLLRDIGEGFDVHTVDVDLVRESVCLLQELHAGTASRPRLVGQSWPAQAPADLTAVEEAR